MGCHSPVVEWLIIRRLEFTQLWPGPYLDVWPKLPPDVGHARGAQVLTQQVHGDVEDAARKDAVHPIMHILRDWTHEAGQGRIKHHGVFVVCEAKNLFADFDVCVAACGCERLEALNCTQHIFVSCKSASPRGGRCCRQPPRCSA